MDEPRKWSPRMRYREMSEYLDAIYGIKLKPKTLANRCCKGTGPKLEYFDTLPHSTTEKIDDWVKNHTSDSPRPKVERDGTDAEQRAVSVTIGKGRPRKHAIEVGGQAA